MRLGLIARADSRGLGVQCKSFHDQMRPTKTMVIDCPSQKPLPLRRDWYPGATWVKGLPTAQDFRRWLQGLDVVYTAETGYSPHLWTEAQRAGVKTVLHTNYEFLNRADKPTLWLAPSMWHYSEVPAPKQFLPVPIESERFAAPARRPLAGPARRFLHIVGRPAVHDRNGTAELLQALSLIKAKVTVTVKCQEPGYVSGLVREHNIHTPNNVTFIVDSGDVPNYWDNYRGHDVLVMPRRFGGLCLPVNEALGAGMPVVMPDISPNNSWLPGEWLVRASKQGSFMAKQRIDYYSVDHRALAAKIDQYATDPDFHTKAVDEATRLRNELSWDALKPEYEKVLANV